MHPYNYGTNLLSLTTTCAGGISSFSDVLSTLKYATPPTKTHTANTAATIALGNDRFFSQEIPDIVPLLSANSITSLVNTSSETLYSLLNLISFSEEGTVVPVSHFEIDYLDTPKCSANSCCDIPAFFLYEYSFSLSFILGYPPSN